MRIVLISELRSPHQILDSNPSSTANPLLIRSSILERRGQIYEAVEDVERALKERDDLRVSLEGTLSYFNMVSLLVSVSISLFLRLTLELLSST